jgi:hypothetical protein
MHMNEHTCSFLGAAREDDNWKCLMCDPKALALLRAAKPSDVGSASSSPVETSNGIGVESSSSSSSSSSLSSSSSHSNGTGGRVVIDID